MINLEDIKEFLYLSQKQAKSIIHFSCNNVYFWIWFNDSCNTDTYCIQIEFSDVNYPSYWRSYNRVNCRNSTGSIS